MAYYFNTMLPASFDDAVARTVAALKEEAFGIISEIDVQKALHEKIGVAFRRYRIPGCLQSKARPRSASVWKTILPCNVVVQELPDGRVEVAAIDPYAMIKALAHRPHTHERELLLGVEPSGAAALESALKFIGEPLLLGLLGNSCGIGEARFLGFALLGQS